VSADGRFGPITTIRREGEPTINIPWTAFTFSEADWQRVVDARDILAVCLLLDIRLLLLISLDSLGLESSSAMFLIGEPGDTMARATTHRRTANKMGEET